MLNLIDEYQKKFILRKYRMRIFISIIIFTLTSLASSTNAEDWLLRAQALGTEDPFRIIVDKVLMKSTGWKVKDKHLRDVAAAAFNVYVPRKGADSESELRRVAGIAAEKGLFTMAWLRGSFVSKGNDIKYVQGNGVSAHLLSPNSNLFWNRLTVQIILVARASIDYPNLIGVFLDFENYDKPRKWRHLYEASYDDLIWNAFLNDQGIPNPKIDKPKRPAWIAVRRLEKAYHAFQAKQWFERCHILRRQIDSINPFFRFAVYPMTNTLFLSKAAYPNWGTQKAPLILAEHMTYVPRHKNVSVAIAKHKKTMTQKREGLGQIGKVSDYIAGLDPAVKGASPEYCGQGARLLGHHVNGYWVFYEGPVYGESSHYTYFRHFQNANKWLSSQGQIK
jgi:hypothetical protein